jgi:hypothetical protein
VALQQRQVLVRRCVVDDVGLDALEDATESPTVPDVGQDDPVVVQKAVALELHLEGVKSGLVVVEPEHHTCTQTL